jgi:CBS domain-containing protein
MAATDSVPLTAGDLMSRDVEVIGADLPLREAAARLVRRGLRSAPVVDDAGRCVGVLSASDLARWAAGRGAARPARPLTCDYLDFHQEPGGGEVALCRLAGGVCPYQRLREVPDGNLAIGCSDPHCVPVDWQVVELEALPGDRVRDFMTTVVVVTDQATTVPELARRMLDRAIHSVVVVDGWGRPVGVVTATDLLQVLAHPEVATPAGAG